MSSLAHYPAVLKALNFAAYFCWQMVGFPVITNGEQVEGITADNVAGIQCLSEQFYTSRDYSVDGVD